MYVHVISDWLNSKSLLTLQIYSLLTICDKKLMLSTNEV